jgi:excisionase family DNA binding protein
MYTKLPERLAYSAEEAADALSISRMQVYRLVRSGELRSRRCGSRILIPRRALEEYLEGEGV